MRCPNCKNELIETESGFICRECNKKYTIKASKEEAIVNKTDGLSSFVCPTCGSREFEDLGGKIKCKCCLNVYDKTEEKISFAADLSQADNFRQTADFARAKDIYERIVRENEGADLTSAYWGIFLCENNVIFESDSRGDVLPSFYRVRDTRVDDNENYKKAIDCSTVFHPEKTASLVSLAEKIEYARTKYFDIARKCEPFDVFICFKNDLDRSSEWARDIYNRFVKKYNVFFSEETLKDIKTTYRDYEPQIYYALYTAKVMLVLCKDLKEIESQWVKNEWYRFSVINKRANLDKAIIPIFIDGFNPDDLPDDLWHIQGLRTGNSLLADLENQLDSIFKPVDLARYSKEKFDEAEKARREKSLELEKELRESQARLAELEKTFKSSTLPESVQKLQNSLKIMWIKIENFGSFGEARSQANEIIRTMPECSSAWLGLAYADFYARNEKDFIKNFRYYDNPNFKLAYKYGSPEEKKKFDTLREQYELNNEIAAKELIKIDNDYIHNTLLTLKDASLMDMRSFYNRLVTTVSKIDTFDEEYKKFLGEDVEEINSIKNDVVKAIAEKVSDTFIEYSKDSAIDVLDYDNLLNRAESFMPDESKEYFIDNCYPTAKTIVETAVATQTDKFKDIIQQSDDAYKCSEELKREIDDSAEEFRKKKEKLTASSNEIYIKKIRRRWRLNSLLFTLLSLVFAFVEFFMCEDALGGAITYVVATGLLWLFGFSEYRKIRKKSPLLICEIISLALYLTTFFVQSFREQWYSPQFLVLRIFIIVLGAALLAFTIQNVCYSPKRRHPKNSSDLDDLDTKKSAYKYYCKRYSAKSEELQKEYAALMQSKFSKLMQLDHDLGGVALKCKVTGVNDEDQLLRVLKCYQEKVQEIKRFFYLAIKQANGVLVKVRKYGR